ncbi:MAG TPA: acetyl-CoA C-acetyltransferase [Acidobacteriota bacterium]|nr:acetyl-CoA C-acetyltransferase [Acidobacteriota bacterium]HMZ78816.1 acetyl-CoA C-acetyltransferase [Acidobacteriota bacterium]HNG92986.1 acetyl-CoA C-acetyltransferase [Acidobacteriota bacterium]HNH84688.1 acetyl-CoA C-acetyltransferase [Acidobacteriota bacterium]HNJ40834.1 acetyl-CoA C-acetyltransferase [Acidobacteriota bacterium]
MSYPVILSAVRLPIGKFQGSLKSFRAPELGALAVRAAIERAGIDAAQVDEVVMGNVLQAGLGQNPARQAALGAGCPTTVAALTVNQVCGSGLRSVMLAAQSIQTGDAQFVVAGGMESMTNAPYLLQRARDGYRLGHGEMLDSMIQDGLWCAFDNWHMGNTGEYVAEHYNVTREDQDNFAAGSHAKAVAAVNAGKFTTEIQAVSIQQKKGDPIVFSTDEGPRADTTASSLVKLRPAFKKDGTVTAGNASSINDGAAAVVVTSEQQAAALGRAPMARIVAQAMSGVDPKLVMMAPVEAVKKVIVKAGWKLDDVDLFELNEAFSAQAVAVTREIGADPARVNVNGGAVALGHPIGASGARVLVTLLHALKDRGAKRGVASLCLGGGNAVALAVECL